VSPRRKRQSRRRPWYHRVRPATWGLLFLLLVASASLVIGPWFRQLNTSQGKAPQIQILNGSRVRGLAGRVAEQMRNQGLDVVSVGNADSNDYGETLVLLRRGDMAVAHRVVRALGLGTSIEQLDPTLLVDVTVILGTGYAAHLDEMLEGPGPQ
jgi:hypothetical protein